MEERKKKDFGDLCPADGLAGRKTVKAEFRSLPSSTDPSKKSHFYPTLLFLSNHESKVIATGLDRVLRPLRRLGLTASFS